jgi:hypothetical protein
MANFAKKGYSVEKFKESGRIDYQMAFRKVSMKKIILFFILILFLIGNAPLVKAECGWILWLKNETYLFANEPKERVSWDIVFAYPKFNQCQEGRNGMYRQVKKSKLDQRKNDKTIEETCFKRASKREASVGAAVRASRTDARFDS